MGKIYVVSVKNTKILVIDSKRIHGHGLSQTLSYAESKTDIAVNLEKLLSRADNVDTGYVLKVALEVTDSAKKVLLNFSICPDNKTTQNMNTQII